MFSWLFGNKNKFKREKTYACKHCKLSCETCTTMFCYSCYSNPGNPCPKCGKTNLMEKEQNKTKD